MSGGLVRAVQQLLVAAAAHQAATTMSADLLLPLLSWLLVCADVPHLVRFGGASSASGLVGGATAWLTILLQDPPHSGMRSELTSTAPFFLGC